MLSIGGGPQPEAPPPCCALTVAWYVLRYCCSSDRGCHRSKSRWWRCDLLWCEVLVCGLVWYLLISVCGVVFEQSF